MHTATMPRIDQADATSWGQSMAATARSTAAVLVAVYTAGLVLGAWVHHLSASMAAGASRSHRTTQPASAAPQRAAAAVDRLSVRELRQLARQAGHRALARSGRRSDLLQALAG
jgi:heme A synthase